MTFLPNFEGSWDTLASLFSLRGFADLIYCSLPHSPIFVSATCLSYFVSATCLSYGARTPPHLYAIGKSFLLKEKTT